MDDHISRQAAISDFEWCKAQSVDKDKWQEAIDRIKALPSAEEESFEWCDGCKEYDPKDHCCHRFTKVIRNTVEDIRNEQRWIPVLERLPITDDLVLIAYDIRNHETNYALGWHDGHEWNCWDDRIYIADEPIAWQPLPEPYKDGD